MKFWIDECLTPTLVGHAHSHGYEATSTRDRGQLGMRDDELLALAVSEEFVFVTNNHADFVVPRPRFTGRSGEQSDHATMA